ncbi:MAG: hypothetical protein A2020_16145 [Lentisphaerae bacterium GWF2_45_14]|nr:MAG: hypothetical protein A2020_16145 [Lentisphaerae bacterium GWF2_45_14]
MSVEKHILSDESMKAMREKWHKDCVVCGETGMEIKHTVSSANSLETEFFCHEKFNGYNDRLHGGIITALMDSAKYRKCHSARAHATADRTSTTRRDWSD